MAISPPGRAHGRVVDWNGAHLRSEAPMPLPHAVVRDAAQIAHAVARQCTRSGQPHSAAYFGRLATEADRRAERLLFLQATFSRGQTVRRQRQTMRGWAEDPDSVILDRLTKPNATPILKELTNEAD